MPRFVISAFDKLRRYNSYHERTPDRVWGRLFARWYDRPFDFVSLEPVPYLAWGQKIPFVCTILQVAPKYCYLKVVNKTCI